MAGKFYDAAGTRHMVLGVPDSAGGQYPVDVDSSNRLLVNVATSAGGVLNSTGQVSVGNSATRIIAAGTRQGVLITNPSASVTVYIGGSGVTSSNGQELLPGNSITLPVTSAVYGVVATGTQTVSFAEVV
jgi:hypothetical protein